MAFTRDYSTTTPIDHTLNSSWPDYDRRAKVDVADRLATIISGFVSGETVLGALKIPFIAVSKPSTITDQIQLYGKVVSTKTELHAVDEDGNEIQLTTGGKTNAAALAGVYPAANVAALATMLNFIYPIGSVYINVSDSTNPATLLGIGTWVALGAGRMIVGYDASDTSFDSAGETGGANTATLTTNELPAHTHTISCDKPTDQGSVVGSAPSGNGFASTKTTGSSGSGAAFSILNKYVTCYTWKRTA